MPYFGFRLFHRFYLFSTVSIIVILFVAGLGLRHVLRNLIVLEAEDDAIHISTAVRDCEIHEYIGQHYSKNDPFLTIPLAELPEVDRQMRVFIAPFHIVKIKIYNTEPRIIYSTDPTIIGKQLTGIAFMMEVLGKKLSDKSLTEQMSYAEKINERVGQAVEKTRKLARGLHPVDFDRNGLVSALQELAANTEELFGISCSLKCDQTVSVEDVSTAINVYRIAQEAITNAVKHGKATKITMDLAPHDDRLILTVENDGLEFPSGPTQNGGMGLKIMHHRAEVIDGSLHVCQGTDGGTIVACAFSDKGLHNQAGGHQKRHNGNSQSLGWWTVPQRTNERKAVVQPG